MDNRGDLIKIASELLHAQRSDYAGDYRFRIPKYELCNIERQNIELRRMAIKIRQIANHL